MRRGAHGSRRRRSLLALLTAALLSLAVGSCGAGDASAPAPAASRPGQVVGQSSDPVFAPFGRLGSKISVDATNGMDKLTGREVLAAAAAAIRTMESVRWVTSAVLSKDGTPLTHTTCSTRDAMSEVTLQEAHGETVEILEFADYRYQRRSVPLDPMVRPDQWRRAPTTIGVTYTIEKIARGLEADAAKASRSTRSGRFSGWPTIEVKVGDKTFSIAAAGPALPLAGHEASTPAGNPADTVFEEYNADCDLRPPDASKVYVPPGT